ncbi:MAG: MYXO-CTERM sorting domain-containing protein [Polyangiaceae bacterium]
MGVAVAPSIASAQDLRYTATAPGGIIATGNTLGLSKELNANGPGTRDSIGTFLTLGNSTDDTPANLANPWPPGTTYDWTQNGSTAVLDLPVESTVLYAELLWGGSFQYVQDVSAFLDSPVTFTANGMTTDVTPDPTTALTISSTSAQGFAVRYYMRSADVTGLVAAAQSGDYSVEGVPATETTTINSLNAAGWTLVVVYRDQSAPTRNLSVFVGGSFVDENSQQDYSVSGFCAPPAGTIQGTAVVSAIEGDANLTGDQFLIAPSAAGPFVQLSGPNNPANNFFCSQINDSSGVLDTTGTFGAKNHDAAAGVNTAGGRQSWDVTTVPLSSQNGQLSNGQSSATLRTITTGDSYMPILASFAIDVNSPDFSGASTTYGASPDSVTLGDTFTLTATLANAGEVTAQNLSFALPLPPTLSLVSISSDGTSGDISGNSVNGTSLASGIDEGDLAAGQTRTVVMVLSVDMAPPSTSFYPLATWSYDYATCSNGALLSETFTQLTTVTYEPVTTTSSSSSSSTGSGGTGGAPSSGGAGGTGAGAGPSSGGGGEGNTSAGGAGGSSGDGGGVDDDGCNCNMPGAPAAPAWPLALGVVGLAAWVGRRRRV